MVDPFWLGLLAWGRVAQRDQAAGDERGPGLHGDAVLGVDGGQHQAVTEVDPDVAGDPRAGRIGAGG